jgi:UDP-N-acetylmuramate dehydrogenase
MEGLAKIYHGRIERDYPLAPLTTFRAGGAADWFFEPSREEEIGPLLIFLAARGTPVTIFGEGSNVLVRDGGIRGAVIRIGQSLADLHWDGDLLRAGAGLSSRSLAKKTRDEGRGGFEWAAALPGNLGGAIRGNAGAFGGDMAACFRELSGWSFEGDRVSLTRGEVEFAYRQSSLAANIVITRIVLELPVLCDGDREASSIRYDEVLAKRAATQPKGLFTAGSTFKNPEGDQAGRLIDACGLKGRSVGGASVSLRHANFIEATGESVNAAEIEALIDSIAEEVERQTGVCLEREVKIYGEA